MKREPVTSPQRIAAIDIGTNTFLLLIADAQDGQINPVHQSAEFIRLGEGVDQTGLITQAAMQRGLACLRRFAKKAAELKVEKIYACGTSALRDAKNSVSFLHLIRAETGVKIRIISGEEEARLSYLGALSNLDCSKNQQYCVLDIGGGSTELCYGRGLAFEERVSLNLGVVRFTERFFKSDPVSSRELENAAEVIRTIWFKSGQKKASKETELVGVSGTPIMLAAMEQKISPRGIDQIEGFRLSIKQVQKWRIELAARTIEERKALPGMSSNRADIILAGALILEKVMKLAGFEALRVSTRGLRFGIALQEFEK